MKKKPTLVPLSHSSLWKRLLLRPVAGQQDTARSAASPRGALWGPPVQHPASYSPAGIRTPSTTHHLLRAPVSPRPPGCPRPPRVQPVTGSSPAPVLPRPPALCPGQPGDSRASATHGDTEPKGGGTAAIWAFYRPPAWVTRPRPPARRCPAAQRGSAERRPPRGTCPTRAHGPFGQRPLAPGGVGRVSPNAAPPAAAGNGPAAPHVPGEEPSARRGWAPRNWAQPRVPHGAGGAASPCHTVPRRRAPRPRC